MRQNCRVIKLRSMPLVMPVRRPAMRAVHENLFEGHDRRRNPDGIIGPADLVGIVRRNRRDFGRVYRRAHWADTVDIGVWSRYGYGFPRQLFQFGKPVEKPLRSPQRHRPGARYSRLCTLKRRKVLSELGQIGMYVDQHEQQSQCQSYGNGSYRFFLCVIISKAAAAATEEGQNVWHRFKETAL